MANVARVRLGPRLVVAGTHSGVGKTTVATGLMAALRRRGTTVAPAKVGPDFIDPGYHSLATGRPGRNLDAWMSGAGAIEGLAARAADGAEVLVVEGVMGLFDGAADGTPSSTATVASLIDAPVLLVVDTSSMSASVAAVVHGFATLDPTVWVAGVVLNKVASESHEAMLRAALDPVGIPVLGVLGRDPELTWRDRHLGLVPVVEHPATITSTIGRLAERIDAGCDLDAVMSLARSAPVRHVEPLANPTPRAGAAPVRIAVAGGAAFSFSYPDNVEALATAGAEIIPFDPLRDEALPDRVAAVVIGGGFPEVYASELSANRALSADLRSRVDSGVVVWAECGGLLWLADRLDDAPMAGLVPAAAVMTERLTLGYRQAVTTVATPLGPLGTSLRGHEFHYSTVEPAGTALEMTGRSGPSSGGFGSERLLASYLHVHLGADPALAQAFVGAVRTAAGTTD